MVGREIEEGVWSRVGEAKYSGRACVDWWTRVAMKCYICSEISIHVKHGLSHK